MGEILFTDPVHKEAKSPTANEKAGEQISDKKLARERKRPY